MSPSRIVRPNFVSQSDSANIVLFCQRPSAFVRSNQRLQLSGSDCLFPFDYKKWKQGADNSNCVIGSYIPLMPARATAMRLGIVIHVAAKELFEQVHRFWVYLRERNTNNKRKPFRAIGFYPDVSAHGNTTVAINAPSQVCQLLSFCHAAMLLHSIVARKQHKQDSAFLSGQKGRLSDNAWSFKEFPR